MLQVTKVISFLILIMCDAEYIFLNFPWTFKERVLKEEQMPFKSPGWIERILTATCSRKLRSSITSIVFLIY